MHSQCGEAYGESTTSGLGARGRWNAIALPWPRRENTGRLEAPVRFRLSPRVAVLPIVAAGLLVPTVRATAPIAAAESVRDMAPATPESVGFSAERVRRIDAKMKQLVDENRLAGVVTLLTRHGKIV